MVWQPIVAVLGQAFVEAVKNAPKLVDSSRKWREAIRNRPSEPRKSKPTLGDVDARLGQLEKDAVHQAEFDAQLATHAEVLTQGLSELAVRIDELTAAARDHRTAVLRLRIAFGLAVVISIAAIVVALVY